MNRDAYIYILTTPNVGVTPLENSRSKNHVTQKITLRKSTVRIPTLSVLTGLRTYSTKEQRHISRKFKTLALRRALNLSHYASLFQNLNQIVRILRIKDLAAG
jgi:hypothetical protein